MLDQNYDAREIPTNVRAARQPGGTRQPRGSGIHREAGANARAAAQITKLITTTYKADLEARAKKGLVSSGPEFQLLMSALKRDNGVIALDYDLYDEARDDLDQAVKLRSNDPRAHYYLGQVMIATGRTPEEKQQAMSEFLQAIQYDAERGAYAEPHLEEALFQISQNDPGLQDQIKKELKTYVALYQRQHTGQLPANMYIIYDYFLLIGDKSWYMPPASVITTKNVDSLNVTQASVRRQRVRRKSSREPPGVRTAVERQYNFGACEGASENRREEDIDTSAPAPH